MLSSLLITHSLVLVPAIVAFVHVQFNWTALLASIDVYGESVASLPEHALGGTAVGKDEDLGIDAVADGSLGILPVRLIL